MIQIIDKYYLAYLMIQIIEKYYVEPCTICNKLGHVPRHCKEKCICSK